MVSDASALSREALDRLLARLDGDRERAGRRYETLRAGLVRFFEWRGSPFPVDNADEALDRVARKVDAGEEIHDLPAYTAGVARLLLKESVKERERQRAALRQWPAASPSGDEDSEARLACIAECLRQLPAGSGELVLAYYRDERSTKIERRRELARQLGIDAGALRMRLQRLRARLEECAADCLRRSTGE